MEPHVPESDKPERIDGPFTWSGFVYDHGRISVFALPVKSQETPRTRAPQTGANRKAINSLS